MLYLKKSLLFVLTVRLTNTNDMSYNSRDSKKNMENRKVSATSVSICILITNNYKLSSKTNSVIYPLYL